MAHAIKAWANFFVFWLPTASIAKSWYLRLFRLFLPQVLINHKPGLSHGIDMA